MQIGLMLFRMDFFPMKPLKIKLDLLINLIFEAVPEIFINFTLKLFAI
jgi:hypothetical protein